MNPITRMSHRSCVKPAPTAGYIFTEDLPLNDHGIPQPNHAVLIGYPPPRLVTRRYANFCFGLP